MPGGGCLVSPQGVSGVRHSPSPSNLSLEQAAGASSPFSVCARRVCVGSRHPPDSARSCELHLRAMGAAQGCQEGGASCLSEECPGLGTLPSPTVRPWATGLEPAARFRWAPGVWAWGPVTYPTTHAVASWLYALWGRHKGARTGAPLASARGVQGRALSTRHGISANAGLPTTTEQASPLLELTTTHLEAHHLLEYPGKLVRPADVRTPALHIRKGGPLHLGDTTVHLGVTQAVQHHNLVHLNKLEGRLAQVPQLARGDLLSTQGPAYFMEAVLNAAIGYQALHLPDPQGALRHARQQLTKAGAQHGGWPTFFPKEAMVAHWRYYGDNTGALVDTAYAKHAAQLLHRMTDKHHPDVREAAAIRINDAQTARKACSRWLLAQHSVPTSVSTGIWAQLQLLLPHHTHAMLTNHHCDLQGPLVARYTDIHRHPERKVDALRLLGATITMVYITPTQMKVVAQCRAPHAPFLSNPQ